MKPGPIVREVTAHIRAGIEASAGQVARAMALAVFPDDAHRLALVHGNAGIAALRDGGQR